MIEVDFQAARHALQGPGHAVQAGCSSSKFALIYSRCQDIAFEMYSGAGQFEAYPQLRTRAGTEMPYAG
jgi:hypothetical protein